MPMSPLSEASRTAMDCGSCLEDRLGSRLHQIAMVTMNIAVRMMPGRMPETNRLAMLFSVMKPYTTKAALGGMRMPRLPPAAMEPNDSLSSYPSLRIDGRAALFIVTAVAMLSPHTAPNAAHAPTVAMASPPRKCPSHLSKVSNAAAMTPPAPAMTPISTNSGMTTRIGEVDTS